MEFGTFIADTRKAKGIKQVHLAQALGCSVQFLSDVEHCKRIPGDEIMAAIAVSLELNVDCLHFMAGKVGPGLRGLAYAQIADGLARFKSLGQI